jgi:hypothetical protein
MAIQRRGLGRILPVATLLAALVGSCTEPRDTVEQIDPNQTQTTEQSDEQVAQQVDNGWPRDPSPNIPTTEERVHVGRDEFEISGPYTHENLEVFLLHNKSRRAPRRKIMTLEEAMRQNKVKVHETGDVQQLAIENLTTDTDIWVQSGDIVQGGKQDRVLSKDLLVPPKSGKMPLASFCVERGRWSGRSSETLRQVRDVDAVAVGLGGGGSYPTAGFSSSRNAISSKELKKAVRLASAQQEVWNEVSNAQTKLTRNIGENVVLEEYATSLEMTLSGKKVQDAVAKYKKALGEILAGKKNVVGYAFAINGKMNSAEIYASGELFSKLWSKMLQATAVEAVSIADEKKKGGKATTKESVKAFLAVKKDTTGRGQQVNDRMQSIVVDGKSIVFSETRDKQADSSWVHRSYFAK